MVSDINQRISAMNERSGQGRVVVECVTCHRGQYRPLLIVPVLRAARDADGIDGVIAKYSELRERYLGNHTYDLRPSTLAGFARGMAAEGDVDGALRLLSWANESFPNEERVLFALVRVNQQLGNDDQALVSLRRLVELFPDSEFYTQQLAAAVAQEEEGE